MAFQRDKTWYFHETESWCGRAHSVKQLGQFMGDREQDAQHMRYPYVSIDNKL